jgi:predicted heme/steroid binding protein
MTVEMNPFTKEWRDSVNPGDPVHYPSYGYQWWMQQFSAGTIDELIYPTIIHNPETPDVSRHVTMKVSVKAWDEIKLVTEEIAGERYQTEYKFQGLQAIFFGITIDRELGDNGPDYLIRYAPLAYTPNTIQQYTFPSFDVPLLSPGTHQIRVYFSPVFKYSSKFVKCVRPWPSPWWSCHDLACDHFCKDIYTFGIWTFIDFTVDVRDPLVHPNFSAVVSGQYAPVTVAFSDQSQVDPHYPIESWYWDFGDPNSLVPSSTAQNPVHVYDRPGAYIVSLTVRNQYGPQTITRTVPVLAMAPHVVFSTDCWFPNKLDNPHEKFTPYLVVDNQGGAGYIYAYYVIEGRRYDLAPSVMIPGYGRYQITMPADKDITYWLHRQMGQISEVVTFEFYVGTIGEAPSDTLAAEVGIVHGESPSNLTALAVGVGAVALIATGAIIMTRRKR